MSFRVAEQLEVSTMLEVIDKMKDNTMHIPGTGMN